jgi:hypothetical protein
LPIGPPDGLPLLANYAQQQTDTVLENRSLPATPSEMITTMCAQLRAQGDNIVSTLTPDIRTRVENAMKDGKVNQMAFMGVLGEDPNACYASMLQRFRAETGAEVEQVVVFAGTIVKNKLVY